MRGQDWGWKLAAAAALVLTASGPAFAQLRASILPDARSVTLPGGGQAATATVFATVINAGGAALSNCRVTLDTPGLTLRYEPTDPATNAIAGPADTPFDLAASGSQSLLLSFTGTAAITAQLAPQFVCDGTAPAPVRAGVNTVDVTLSASPLLDIIPIALALPDLDGIVKVSQAGGSGAMAVAAINIGASRPVRISASATSGSADGFSGAVLICETNASGQCLAPHAPFIDTSFDTDQVRTYTLVLRTQAFAGIGLDPAATRIRIDFHDLGTGRRAGGTSVAVRSPEPQGLALSHDAAARFLTQASFGPTWSDVDSVARGGIEAWLDAQLAMPPLESHWDYVERGGPPGCVSCEAQYINATMESFWRQAATGDDQLRQRAVFALSEIFVVSSVNSAIDSDPYAHAAWLDMLGEHAFGNYRDLLEAVTRHPAMGYYLSHIRNEREDAATGRIPDENYAREVMQLFSIGLWELNPDGSRRLDGQGQPIPTYGQPEIAGMARVFTGLSWGTPDTSDSTWHGWNIWPNTPPWNVPMQMFERYHSTSEKRIVSGVVIAPNTPGDESLRIALDTLANHPNTGPFISEQLIKRLVTSNPSREYVGRVAAVWADNGDGERGDLAAVFRAILTDPEARDAARIDDPEWGKLREPMLRFSAWMRAFAVRPPDDADGRFQIWNLEDPVQSLGQNPLRAPSVFNWFRPDYAPPGAILDAGLVAPEFQITHETTVTGYSNFMRDTVLGDNWRSGNVLPDYSPELALAGTPDALIARLDLLLTSGQLSAATRSEIRTALEAIPYDDPNGPILRVVTAVQLILASPDFVVQR
ncbi:MULTISPECIES: DUF1800 domain-containing protein [Hyphobacterium]|uniref:DUF1800 domain-containing protein n=1 Tax=Hyphobacterium vulgare TaxID=1736751 RepID=A0ABV7A166_9PROT